jgi:hypothetical protein
MVHTHKTGLDSRFIRQLMLIHGRPKKKRMDTYGFHLGPLSWETFIALIVLFQFLGIWNVWGMRHDGDWLHLA